MVPRMALAALSLALLALPGAHALLNNTVSEWSTALNVVLRTYNIRHQNGLRAYALLHQAQYNALTENLKPKYKYDAALVTAVTSHRLLASLFPDQQSNSFDVLIAKQLGNYSGVAYVKAYALAKAQVLALLRARLDDESQKWFNRPPAPANSTPGLYQWYPGQTQQLYPQLGFVTPFNVPLNLSTYAPDSVTSAAFLADLQETYAVGGKTSGAVNATNATKDTADFWADGTGTSQHGGHWNNIALQLLPGGLTLLESARILALLNTAAYDANIVTWRLKYRSPGSFWRPITAIRQGFAGYTPDPAWSPYLSTPPHPEYPSGHSTTAGAFGGLLAWYLNSDSINATISTEGPSQIGSTLSPRTYTSISAIVTEVNLSRIYGGVHFRKAVRDAEAIGRWVGQRARLAFGYK